MAEGQEVFNQCMAVLGGDGFGVELDAVDGQGFVLDGHDDAVLRGGGDV